LFCINKETESEIHQLNSKCSSNWWSKVYKKNKIDNFNNIKRNGLQKYQVFIVFPCSFDLTIYCWVRDKRITNWRVLRWRWRHSFVWGRFHQCFMRNFCAHRSQKCKKTLMTWLSFFALFVYARIKTTCKMLVRLTSGEEINLPSIVWG